MSFVSMGSRRPRLRCPLSLRLLGCLGLAGGLMVVLESLAVAGERQSLASGQYRGANIVLIEVPEVRRDHLGCYGYRRPTSPRLDAMAQEGIRFEHVVAAAPWCVPGKLAVWTGIYPSAHGVLNKFSQDAAGQAVPASLSPAIPTFPELLKQAGYTLMGFTGDMGVAGAFGFSRGFDRYVDDRELGGLDYTVPLAIDWLTQQRQEPFFLFVQGYSAHGLFVPAEGYRRTFAKGYRGPLTGSKEEQKLFRERSLALRFGTEGSPASNLGFSRADQRFYVDLFDEKVQATDQWIGRLLDALDELQLTDRTIVVFFAGHGDEFFDHGFLDHAATLYEELIHVPLIITLPGWGAGHVVRSQVRMVDLFPTLFALLGLTHHDVTGVSLLPILNGQPMALLGFSETQYRLLTHQSAVVTPDHRYKLIYTHGTQRRELYDLARDPGERHDVAAARPEIADALEEELWRLLQAMRPTQKTP